MRMYTKKVWTKTLSEPARNRECYDMESWPGTWTLGDTISDFFWPQNQLRCYCWRQQRPGGSAGFNGGLHVYGFVTMDQWEHCEFLILYHKSTLTTRHRPGETKDRQALDISPKRRKKSVMMSFFLKKTYIVQNFTEYTVECVLQLFTISECTCALKAVTIRILMNTSLTLLI